MGRKHVISEINDFQDVMARKSNLEYLNAFDKDPYCFRKKNGPFTNLYDSAARFGASDVFIKQ